MFDLGFPEFVVGIRVEDLGRTVVLDDRGAWAVEAGAVLGEEGPTSFPDNDGSWAGRLVSEVRILQSNATFRLFRGWTLLLPVGKSPG